MEDLFYFSKQIVTLEDIVDKCNVVGLERSIILEDLANTYYQGDDFWQWFIMQEDEDDFEDFSKALVECIHNFQPGTAITISHCVASLPQLKKVIAHLMQCYGGWVTYDLSDGLVVYDQVTVGKLSHSGFS